MNSHTNFYAQIGTRYGHEVQEIYKTYAKNQQKLGNMISRKCFLVACRKSGLFPAHIVQSLRCTYELLASGSPYTRNLSTRIAQFQKGILNIEIKDTFHRIRVLRNELSDLKRKIEDSTDRELHQQFFVSQEFAYQSNLESRNRQTSRKHQRMVAQRTEVHTQQSPSLNELAILNTTDKVIPQETKILLSLGPKFALPYESPAQIPFYHLIADVEKLFTLMWIEICIILES